MPTAEKRMADPGIPEQRDVPDITEVEDVPLVEVRTGPVSREVIRIHEAGIAPVGGIVNRVAPSIGSTYGELTDVAPYGGLQSMVVGGGLFLQMRDGSVSEERS